MTDPIPAELEAAAAKAASKIYGLRKGDGVLLKGPITSSAVVEIIASAIAAYTTAAGDAQWNAAVLAAAQLADDMMRPAPESAWKSGQSDCAKSLSNRIRALMKGPGR